MRTILIKLSQETSVSTYNVLEAKTHLSRLIDDIESGREAEILLARNGRPAARIVPLAPTPKPRRLGLAEGKFEVPDDIDEVNPIIQRMFDESKCDF